MHIMGMCREVTNVGAPDEVLEDEDFWNVVLLGYKTWTTKTREKYIESFSHAIFRTMVRDFPSVSLTTIFYLRLMLTMV